MATDTRTEAQARADMNALKADIMRADADDERETNELLMRSLVEGLRYTRLPRWNIDDDERKAKENYMRGKERVRSILGASGDVSVKDLWDASSALMGCAVYLGGGALGCSCGCGEDGGYNAWTKTTPLMDVSHFSELTPAGESLALEMADMAKRGDLFSALRLWVYSNGERPWLSDAAFFLAFAMMNKRRGREQEMGLAALALLSDID